MKTLFSFAPNDRSDGKGIALAVRDYVEHENTGDIVIAECELSDRARHEADSRFRFVADGAEITQEVRDNVKEQIADWIKQHVDQWSVGEDVKKGAMRGFESTLYECVLPHTTQADWTPDLTPALWKVIVPPQVIPQWRQPTGAHDAYMKGDKVLRNGKTWMSNIDSNVWEPGVHGWEVVE